MGDLSTHRDVVLHMIPQLQGISNAENYTYVEFGNFLTDISQFRDPTAYIGAKERIRTGAFVGVLGWSVLCGELDGALGSGRLEGWLNTMFGVPAPEDKRHGALPTFFQHLGRAVSHIKFSEDSTRHDPDLTPLSAAEVDRVYDKAFTQYYPDEHVDYPPLGTAPNPNRILAFQTSGRGLKRYLELQIEVISEELSKLEFDWLQNRTLPADHPTRCDLLVRMGHILHAVEDFYFHSNAVELRQWKRVLKQNPGRDPKVIDDYHFLVDHILDGTDITSVRLRRRLARRLSYPQFTDLFEKPPLIGEPQRLAERAIDFVYTGGFGRDDVAHTLSSGMSALEELLKVTNPDALERFQKSQLALVQLLFTEAERHAIAESCSNLSERLTRHKEQVSTVAYPLLLEGLRAFDVLTEPARDAFMAAYALDGQIATQFPGKPGPGGFLFVWMRIIQQEVEASHAKATSLDADTDSPYDPFVSNGASEETVGQHSLMAKDGVEKEPLRKHAMALAKCASAGLAVTLRQRIEDDPDPDKGIDWGRILRHVIRIPRGSSDTWEDEVLAAVEGGADVPPLGSLQDAPTVAMLTGTELAVRRAGRRRCFGETRYRQFEKTSDPTPGNKCEELGGGNP